MNEAISITAKTTDGQTCFSVGTDYRLVHLIVDGEPTTIKQNDNFSWNQKSKTLQLTRKQPRTNRVLFKQGNQSDDKLLLSNFTPNEVDLLIGSIANSARLSHEMTSFSDEMLSYKIC